MSEVIRFENEPTPQQAPSSMLAVIARAASDPDVDVDKLEKLLAMKERMDAKEAEQAFNDAMMRAQAVMRPISADAENPQTRSRYATYAKLDKALRPIYTKEGFSLSFNSTEAPIADMVRMLCYVSHNGGHTRTYQLDMPADGKGAKGNDVMTRTHATGSAASYGSRYLLKMIFNVAVGEDDDDGNGGTQEPPYDLTSWADAITAAVDVAGLKKVKADFTGRKGVPQSAIRNFVALYNTRFRELSGKS